MIKTITVLTLGGTIDAQAITGEYPKYTVQEDLNSAFVALQDLQKTQEDSWKQDAQIAQIKIANKDSKNLNDSDIQNLIDHIQRAKSDRIIVTMGTDRIVEISNAIRTLWKDEDINLPCPVIFTGAMWPLANGPEKSEGFVNLERAAFSNADLDIGVYITGSDILADAKYVEKDFENLTFVITDKHQNLLRSS